MSGYHHGDLRAALLAAARGLLDADPAGDVSLRAVAKAAGVSPNAPYRHFASKEKLLAALAAEGFLQLTARFAARDDADAARRMEGYFEDYLAFAAENPGTYRLMFGRDLSPLTCEPEVGEAAQGCFRSLMSAVAQLVERPLEDPSVARGAATVWSLSHGAAMLVADGAADFLNAEQRPTAKSLAGVVISAFRSGAL